MLDKSKALADFGISEEDFNELLREFVAQACDFASSIEEALKKNDSTSAAMVAHSLKGVSGNLRLDNCYKTAVSIEAALKAGNTADCLKGIAALRDTIEEIRMSL